MSLVLFAVNAQPVCLQKTPSALVGKNTKLVGWGKTAGQTGKFFKLSKT